MNSRSLGNLCAGAAALLFFWLCMLLPLVGRAARLTDHYWRNFLTFLVFLLPAVGLAWYARVVKLRESRENQSPYPWLTTGLFYTLSALLVLLLLGRLHK